MSTSVLAFAILFSVSGAISLRVVGLPTNDLSDLLKTNGFNVSLFPSIETAIEGCAISGSPYDMLFVTAAGYPSHCTNISQSMLHIVRKTCRYALFVEFPCSTPAQPNLQIQPLSHYIRFVVNGSDLMPFGLTNLRIFSAHAVAATLPANRSISSSAIVAARVAGYDTAVYGLPADALPMVESFQRPGMPAYVTVATSFSVFKLNRYAPVAAWASVWNYVLTLMSSGFPSPGVVLPWSPSVGPSYAMGDTLPPNAEGVAVHRAVQHLLHGSKLLYSHRYAATPEPVVTGHCAVQLKDGQEAVPWTELTCIDEGFSSVIDSGGVQGSNVPLPGQCHPASPQCSNTRSDDNCEAASGLAASGNPQAISVAVAIIDYVYLYSGMQVVDATAQDGASGLLCWFSNTWMPHESCSFYGDNDGTSFISTVLVSSISGVARWDVPLLRQCFGMLRTTPQFGFRPPATNHAEMKQRGWKYYFNSSDPPNEHSRGSQPHYQANHWALFLWAYEATGVPLFLLRARTAMSRLMSIYPTSWRWTEYLSEELAHMILPLSWYVRATNATDPEAVQWLRLVTRDMISHQRPCGAIHEFLGDAALGDHPPLNSNNQYGTGEGALIQENADPVADLLYTQNFAHMSLVEACAALPDEADFGAARDKLAAFLVRAQISSSAYPQFDGGWYRGFDVDKWEFWASATDWAYGPWETETGWIAGWISASLALYSQNSSFWDASRPAAARIRASNNVGQICRDFLPNVYCVGV